MTRLADSTPVCGADGGLGGRCRFPVVESDDRCYRHDGGDADPRDDPVAFLDRAAHDPPPWLVERIEDDSEMAGPFLAEYYVRYSRRVASAGIAAHLAALAARRDCLTRTVLCGELFREAGAEGERRDSFPEFQELLRTSRRLRNARRDVGLTAHDHDEEPEVILDLPWRS